MIRKIELHGFKSFVLDEIEFNQLTLLTGLNSSGKSSVVQALRMLENASKNKEVLLEGHGDLAELTNAYTGKLEIVGTLDNSNVVSISSGKETEIVENFPQIIHIAADRNGPQTTIPIFVGEDYSIGSKGENLLKSIEYYEDHELPALLNHPDSQGVTFGFNLEAWLGVVSPNTKFGKEIQKRSDTSYSTFNGHRSKNVGFGLSYTLPIISALLMGSLIENSLVIIENPEAHLHPRGQTEIGRLIAKCAKVGTQIVVETHSDHLIDSIRGFVKDDDSNLYEKINLYWFELGKNGNTDATLIHLDSNGRLEDCPAGLLDQFEINASKLL